MDRKKVRQREEDDDFYFPPDEEPLGVFIARLQAYLDANPSATISHEDCGYYGSVEPALWYYWDETDAEYSRRITAIEKATQKAAKRARTIEAKEREEYERLRKKFGQG